MQTDPAAGTSPFRTILRRPAVTAATGQSRSGLYVSINAGLFPKPVRLVGTKNVGWPADEVRVVNDARIAGITIDDMRALVARLEAARNATASEVASHAPTSAPSITGKRGGLEGNWQ